MNEKKTGHHEQSNPTLLPSAGVSSGVKYFVIFLTLVTIIAFGTFTALLVKRFAFPSTADISTDSPTIKVAKKLEEAGLIDKAIQEYKNFLNQPDVNSKMKSEISYVLGKLFIKKKDCSEALVWFFYSDEYFQDADWNTEVKNNIQKCQGQINEISKQIK